MRARGIADTTRDTKQEYSINTDNSDNLLISAIISTEDARLERVKSILDQNNMAINHKDSSGWTALHWAVAKTDIEITKLLLERGIQSSIASQDGNTAMHFAVLMDTTDIVLLLMNHGDSIEIQNLDGRTPLDIALDKNDQTLASIMMDKATQNAGIFQQQGQRVCEKNLFHDFFFFKNSPVNVTMLKMPGNIQEHNGCTSMAVLQDGRIVSGYQHLHVWDSCTGEALVNLYAGSHIYSIAVLPDGRIATGMEDGTIKLWDSNTYECLLTLNAHKNSVNALALMPDGRLVSGAEKEIIVWDRYTFTSSIIPGPKSWFQSIHSLAISPNGHIVAGYTHGRLAIREMCWWKQADEHAFNCTVRSVICLSDNRIISAADDGKINVWVVNNNMLECVQMLEDNRVRAIVMLPDGHLLSGSYDKTIKMWDIDTGKCLTTYRYNSGITSLAVLPDGGIVSGHADGTFQIDRLTHNHNLEVKIDDDSQNSLDCLKYNYSSC